MTRIGTRWFALLIAFSLVLTLMLLLSRPSWVTQVSSQPSADTDSRPRGIDVSHHQGVIDWNQVHSAGYEFAFVKATEGTGFTDSSFRTNMDNARAVGMLAAPYHFARPDLGNAAADEAQYFVSVARDYLSNGCVRPALDLEVGASLGKEALSNWVNEWMSTVRNEVGIVPIIYVNSNYATNYLNSSITQYGLWIAHWTYDPTQSPNTGVWDNWVFWQYSDRGAVQGITGNVDLDVFNGSRTELQNCVNAVRPGFNTNILPANDDGSTGVVALPFTLNFFGNTYGALFVNNNGNLTFDAPMSTYTPFSLLSTRRVIIAPFFADVDTRAGNVVTYGTGTVGGRPAFGVTWPSVGCYAQITSVLNIFQVVLIDRSDIGPGDFDIEFNYDQIQWETGQASGGNSVCQRGFSARVGYSNGTTSSFELPGSGVNGAFLDSNTSTGLIHNNRNSFQRGRYIFPVRNSIAPTGGTISGTVFQNPPLPGAFVQVCKTDGFCNTTTTNLSGQYLVSGLAAGQYNVRAFPPAGTNILTGQIGPITLAAGQTLTGQDIHLTGPTPPPPGTTITSRGTGGGGVPLVTRGVPLTLTTHGCSGGTASYQILQNGVAIQSSGMTESPAGTYTATVPPLSISGNTQVVITILCPDSTTTTTPFDVIYIDPSGVVQEIAGSPIPGATVTLFRSDSSSGPFVQVPNGSGIMSIANRNNPDTTDAVGHFGWDVIAGFYRVRAEKTGCFSPTNPSQTFVESAVLTIPPPVTDLDLRLTCPPTTTATLSPLPTAGWNNSSVTVTLNATDIGSGVSRTYYAIDDEACTSIDLPIMVRGSQPVRRLGNRAKTTDLFLNVYSSLATCLTYTSPFSVGIAGIHTVYFFSLDNAGNSEETRTTPVRIDMTLPSCALTRVGTNAEGKKFIQVTLQDAGSGLFSINPTILQNAVLSGHLAGTDFPVGTTNPVVVTATKIDQSMSARVELEVKDRAGNTTRCDPVMMEEVREEGKPITHLFTGIPKAESKVTIHNGDPGLKNLSITVNKKRFEVAGLKDNEERTIDVSPAMVEGNNTITLEARGKPGGSAVILIHD